MPCNNSKASRMVIKGLWDLLCSHLERSNETPAVLTMLEAAAKHAAMSMTPGHLMAATMRSTTALQMI